MTVLTTEPVRGHAADHQLGARARPRARSLLGDQPTLEDIYLELTGSTADGHTSTLEVAR